MHRRRIGWTTHEAISGGSPSWASQFVGEPAAIDRDRVQRLLSLSQELYITDLTERYASYVSAGHTRRFDTPMEEGLHLQRDAARSRAAQFLRDQVARDVVTLRHARGAIMIADILTKGVARPLFLELLRLLDDYAALASADAIPEPNSSRSDAVSAPDTPAARRG